MANGMESPVTQMNQVLQSTQELLGVPCPGLRPSFEVVQLMDWKERRDLTKGCTASQGPVFKARFSPQFLPEVRCSCVTATLAPAMDAFIWTQTSPSRLCLSLCASRDIGDGDSGQTLPAPLPVLLAPWGHPWLMVPQSPRNSLPWQVWRMSDGCEMERWKWKRRFWP